MCVFGVRNYKNFFFFFIDIRNFLYNSIYTISVCDAIFTLVRSPTTRNIISYTIYTLLVRIIRVSYYSLDSREYINI